MIGLLVVVTLSVIGGAFVGWAIRGEVEAVRRHRLFLDRLDQYCDTDTFMERVRQYCTR